MNSKSGGPGWDRTNDQPIMSPERSRPTRSSDVDLNTKRPETRPISPPLSDQIDPIGSQDWQSKSRPKMAMAGLASRHSQNRRQLFPSERTLY